MVTMTADSGLDGAEWPPEDNAISTEHVALVEFAHRLGSVQQHNEPGIADASNLKEDANLLMSLFSSAPHVVSDDHHVDHQHNSPAQEPQYHSDSSSSNSSAAHRRDSFRFSHPSLSLDCDSFSAVYDRPLRTPCPTAPGKKVSEGSEDKDSKETSESSSPPPPVLLGRALKIDDRDAHRLSADAMARNLLQSFQKAIQWRVQAWMNNLSESLVQQEKAMLSQNASQEELKELLDTKEARLFLKLRQVQKTMDVQMVETCFQVLPQRVQRKKADEEAAASSSETNPPKRRRIESEDSDLTMMGEETETEYQYTVCHAIEFNGTVHLVTPAGHSEITLEVPGVIEGTFLSAESGMEDLMAVEVEIDTNILSSMVEKSCRIIVRSSVEHICKQEAPAAAAVSGTDPKDEASTTKGQDQENLGRNTETEDSEESSEDEDVAMPPFRPRGSPGGNSVGSNAAIVTPRSKAPSYDYQANHDKAVYLPIPDNLDDKVREGRRISPQPKSLDMESNPFTPMTPSRQEIKSTPSMVSPAPKVAANLDDHGGFRLSQRRVNASPPESSQNLPVLVEVACAQMQVAKGLTGQ